MEHLNTEPSRPHETHLWQLSKRSLHLIYTCILNISNRRDWSLVVIIKLILQLSRGNEQLAWWAISERRHSKVCINLTKIMRMPQGDWLKGHLTWLITKLTIATCYCSVLIMKCFGLEHKFTLNCIQICEDTFNVNLNGHNPFHASERTDTKSNTELLQKVWAVSSKLYYSCNQWDSKENRKFLMKKNVALFTPTETWNAGKTSN